MARIVFHIFSLIFIILLPTLVNAKSCDINRPILFAGNDWDSSNFNVEIARYILERGYGCKTGRVQGTTLPLLNALVRGDIDINMELWKSNNVEIWKKMKKTGRVVETKGVSIATTTQGFYVPKYVIKGSVKRNIKPLAPDLKTIYDLKKYASIFKDPVHPSKGRFYNCKIGWN